ncbi:hypothetical protein CIHG_09555 [Coccidioides immitis H538.4]|uniref:Uncharacterized protein n=2 Tax=Coccidioides immitis TaxID=5501 RepID=A0A0J8UV71_COCIT|nr:hypothetical protein CIRG_04686 [Coccidioides immitis RMSCC 2394]KMU91748.1 hypothetical protein CIHG_09555 [Coccidioides immitis H538.4]
MHLIIHSDSGIDSRIDAGDNHWDSLHSLFYDSDSDPSDTSISIATNKRSRDYEDDEESNTSFAPQGSPSSDSDSDSETWQWPRGALLDGHEYLLILPGKRRRSRSRSSVKPEIEDVSGR